MAEIEQLLEQIERNTRATAQMIALTAGPEVRRRLEVTFDTDPKRKAYGASDGLRSAREVGRIAGTTHSTVGRWWEEWTEAGLATQVEGGTTRGTLELGLFGLDR